MEQHSRQNKGTERLRKHEWTHVLVLAAILAVYILTIHIVSLYISEANLIPLINLGFETVADIIIVPIAIILAWKTANAWRYFFFLIGFENLMRIIISLHLLMKIYLRHFTLADISTRPLDAIGIIFFTIKPIYCGLFFILAVRQLRPKIKKFITTLPILITMILILVLITSFYQAYQEEYKLTLWALISGYQDVIILLFLIYLLPIAKNKSILFVIISLILILVGYIFGNRLNYALPYFDTFNTSYLIWTAGNILLINSLYRLLKKDSKDYDQWFYPFDSTYAQIGYWSSSIASTLFILISMRHITLYSNFHSIEAASHLNVRLILVFMSILPLLVRPFAQLFTKDFNVVSNMVSSISGDLKAQQKTSHKIHFKEIKDIMFFLKIKKKA